MVTQGSTPIGRRANGRRPGLPPLSHRHSQRLNVARAAATDANVGTDKYERLLATEERASSSEARVAFERDFIALQAELPVIPERGVLPGADGRPKATYALWEDLNETIKPYLTKHGFGLSFSITQQVDRVHVTGRLCHVGGHASETTLSLPVDLSDGKNAVQAIGSSTSYGKRYATVALLNITTAGEDDDGVLGGRARCITSEQAAELNRTLVEAGADRARFLRLCNAASVEAIPATGYRLALSILRAKAARK